MDLPGSAFSLTLSVSILAFQCSEVIWHSFQTLCLGLVLADVMNLFSSFACQTGILRFAGGCVCVCSYICKIDFPVWGEGCGHITSFKAGGAVLWTGERLLFLLETVRSWDWSVYLRATAQSRSPLHEWRQDQHARYSDMALDKPGSCLLALLVPWASARPSLCIQKLKRLASNSFWIGLFTLLFCL